MTMKYATVTIDYRSVRIYSIQKKMKTFFKFLEQVPKVF